MGLQINLLNCSSGERSLPDTAGEDFGQTAQLDTTPAAGQSHPLNRGCFHPNVLH